MPGVRWRLEKSARAPELAGGIQFLPAPPSGAESTVSPILMYLLYGRGCPLAFHSAWCRSCLHLYRITRPSSLESAVSRAKTARRPRPTGPLVSRAWPRCAPAHRLRDEPGQDRGHRFPKVKERLDYNGSRMPIDPLAPLVKYRPAERSPYNARWMAREVYAAIIEQPLTHATGSSRVAYCRNAAVSGNYDGANLGRDARRSRCGSSRGASLVSVPSGLA